jgi:hypothetical protein
MSRSIIKAILAGAFIGAALFFMPFFILRVIIFFFLIRLLFRVFVFRRFSRHSPSFYHPAFTTLKTQDFGEDGQVHPSSFRNQHPAKITIR